MVSIFVCSGDDTRLKQWDKRRWKDAPDAVKRTIQQYIASGWSPTSCTAIGTQLYEFDLEQTISQEFERETKFWLHHKHLMVKKCGKVEHVKNGETMHWTKPHDQAQPDTPAAPPALDEKPKAKRGRKPKAPKLKPGDCCKIPSGHRVFIDQALDNGRYAVTWEIGGMRDEFPVNMLTLVNRA